MPVSCSSCIMRVSGEVFHRDDWHRLGERLRPGIDLHEQPGLLRGRVVDDPIGPQRLAVLGNLALERLRNRLPLGEQFVVAQRLAQHQLDPGPMNGRIGPAAQLVVVPLVERHAQPPSVVRIVGIESLRKRLRQHRQTQERA